MNQSFQFHDKHKISVFIGAYGSGKSEVSANFSVWLAQSGYRVTLCDLDIINPYFRTSDAAAALSAEGVSMVSPQFAGTNADVPALPGGLLSVFDQKDLYGVFDIGGEDLGARAVATVRPRLAAADHAIYMVVNVNRPCTDTAARIVRQAYVLEKTTGLPISGLVQNTNLLEYSQSESIDYSDETIEQAARQLSLPVSFAAALPEAVPPAWSAKSWPVLRLKRFIRYPGQALSAKQP